MNLIFSLLLILVADTAAPTNPTLKEVRTLYQRAATESSACKHMMSRLEGFDQSNHPLFFGYRGSATMMMAKYVSNPFSKLSHFRTGKAMLNKAIAASENNMELRFLRFAAQTESPAFLGYKDDIAFDRDFLLRSVRQAKDPVLKETVILFMQRSPYVSAEQKKLLI